MNAALNRRLAALEGAQKPPECPDLVVQFVAPGCGTVAALLLPTGLHLDRADDETEAAFLTRVRGLGMMT
jgi:hypothetical protein